LSDFRLDKYEVTVGRFRKFVDAWVGGWRPSAGAGKHTHLNGGAGLVSTAGGNEPGWDATWNSQLGTAKPNWDTNLTSGVACNGDETWTSAPGSNEKKPQNCLSWYDLYAFCIWDGGFLPSYAEWEYAAAGGSAERPYPWGSATPTSSLAVYGTTSTANVGGLSAGAGRWGQLDLAGNVSEWNLDWDHSRLVSTCENCTDLRASSDRVLRGGAFLNVESFLSAASRQAYRPWDRFAPFGGRCARTP
jgi:formylglycine-generating enzyme required for sulfatase activity